MNLKLWLIALTGFIFGSWIGGIARMQQMDTRIKALETQLATKP